MFLPKRHTYIYIYFSCVSFIPIDSFFSMSGCTGLNRSREDFYYLQKIHPDNKSWAWWLNNLGSIELFFLFRTRKNYIFMYFHLFRYIIRFYYWFLWKHSMSTCSLPSTLVSKTKKNEHIRIDIMCFFVLFRSQTKFLYTISNCISYCRYRSNFQRRYSRFK